MNWGECQIAALQKMFLINTNSLEINDSTKPYLAAMPQAANEALRMIATVGRFVVKSYVIEQAATPDQKNGQCERWSKYVLPELIEDFYRLMPNSAVFETLDSRQGADFGIEGEHTLVLDGRKAGRYTIYYYAYPATITSDTAADTPLNIPREAEVLVPLYIASQLYKDDDNSIATIYRNEFEIGLERLNNAPSSGAERFNSVTGWW